MFRNLGFERYESMSAGLQPTMLYQSCRNFSRRIPTFLHRTFVILRRSDKQMGWESDLGFHYQ
jgi:hypothetical protein